MGDLILRLIADVDQFAQGLNQARGHFRAFSQDLTAQATADRTRLAQDLQRYTTMLNTLQRELLDLERAKAAAQTGGPSLSNAQKDRMADLLRDIGLLKVRISETRQEMNGLNQAASAAYRSQAGLLNLVTAQVTAQLQSLVNAGTMLRQIGGIFRNLSIPLLAFTAATVGAAMKLGSLGAQYSQTIDIVRSSLADMVSPAKEAEDRFTQLVRVIEDLGEKLKYTTSEVATAARFLAQAGLSTNEVITALPGTLNLALSGMLELGRAAEISADFMNAFQLSGSQVSMVADVMAKTAVIANTSVEQLGNAFSFVTPVAATMGQSIQDVAAALAALSNSAIKSSRAGTGLAQILSGLVKDQDKTEALLSKYGSSFERVNPQVVSLIDIIEEFKRVGVSAGDVMKFFGERAGRSMLALTNLPTAELRKFREQIDDSFGAALEQASRRWQNLSGAIAEFQSKLEAIALAVFNAVKGDILESMRSLTDWLGKVAAALRDPVWQPYIRAAVMATAAISGFTAALGALLLVGFVVFTAIGGVTAAFASMAISVNSAEAALVQAQVAENLAAAQALALASANTAAGASYNVLATRAAASAAALNASVARLGAGIPVGGGTGALATWQLGLQRVMGFVGGLGAALSRLAVPIAIVTTLVLAAYQAWAPLENGMAKTASVSGLLATVWGVLKEAAQALVAGFKFVQKSLSDLFANVGISAWGVLVHVIRELAQSLSDLWEYLRPFIPGFSALVGVLLGVAGAVLKIGLDVFILWLAGCVKFVQLLISGVGYLADKFWGATEAVLRFGAALAGVFSERWGNRFKEAADDVAKFREEVAKANKEVANAPRNKNDDINTLKASRIEGRKFKDDTLSLQQYMNLLEKADKALYDMTTGELLQLEALSRKFGDVNDEVAAVVTFVDAQMPRLQAIVKGTAEDSEQHRAAKNSISVLEEMKRQAQEVQTQYGLLAAAASDAVGPGMADRAADLAKNMQELERRAREAAEAGKELQENTTKYYQVRDRMMESELSGYQKEIFELEKLTKAYDEATAARDKALMARVSTLEQDIIQQAQKEQATFEEYDRVRAEKRAEADLVPSWTDAQKEAYAEDQSKRAAEDAERSAAGLAQTRSSLKEMKEEYQKFQDERAQADSVYARKKSLIEKKYQDKQTELIQDQKIEAAKASEDKVLVAELEAEKYIAAEKKKIEEIFVLNTAANQALKAQALAHVDAVAAAKIDKARREAEEERVKERKKMLKEALDPIKTMEEEAAKSVAKHVKGVRELISLYIALHQIRKHQELEARRGFNIAMKAQEAYIRQQHVADADPGSDLKSDLAEKRKRQAAFSAMVAGRRMGIAGLTPEQIDLFMEGSGGKPGASAPGAGASIGVLVTIKDTLGRIEAILNATQTCVCGGPAAAKAGGGQMSVPPEEAEPTGEADGGQFSVPPEATGGPITLESANKVLKKINAAKDVPTESLSRAEAEVTKRKISASIRYQEAQIAETERKISALTGFSNRNKGSFKSDVKKLKVALLRQQLTKAKLQEELNVVETTKLNNIKSKRASSKTGSSKPASKTAASVRQANLQKIADAKIRRMTAKAQPAPQPGDPDYVDAGIRRVVSTREELSLEKMYIKEARQKAIEESTRLTNAGYNAREKLFEEMQQKAFKDLQKSGEIPRNIKFTSMADLSGKISGESWDKVYNKGNEEFKKMNGGQGIQAQRIRDKAVKDKLEAEAGAAFDRANPQPVLRQEGGMYLGSPISTEEEAAANGAIGQGSIIDRLVPVLQTLSAVIPRQVQGLAPTMNTANMGSALASSLVAPGVPNLAVSNAGSTTSTQTTNENKTFVITINNNADLGQFKARFNEIVGEAALT